MLRWALLVPVLLVVGYFAVGLFVVLRMTAPSRETPESTPAAVGLEFMDVDLKSTDGIRLSAWWISNGDPPRAALLIHGWGGDKSDEHVLQTARVYERAGYGVLLLDLRAQGESDGNRRTLGYRETRDVRGALAWLEKRGYPEARVVLHGWSMGGATVVRAAPDAGVAAVVEEAAYADLPLLLEENLPTYTGLPAFFEPGIMLIAGLWPDLDPWDVKPEREAARLSAAGVPFLVIHSTTDAVIPYEHARRFAEAHPEAKLWTLEGYDHVEAYTHPAYEEKIQGFLEVSSGESR